MYICYKHLSAGVILNTCLRQPHKEKNISHDVFGSKLGRIHMQRQDFSKLQTRKSKALKRSAKPGSQQHSKKAKLD